LSDHAFFGFGTNGKEMLPLFVPKPKKA